MGRWVLYGWVVLIVVLLGLVVGYLLYSRLLLSLTLEDQAALLNLPENLVVNTQAQEKADITLRGDVGVDVPFKDDALALPLKGNYRAKLSLDTQVPISMNIHYQDVIPVETTVSIAGDTSLVYGWLPKLPLRGDIPIKLMVPVDLDIPVDTAIRFVYSGPVDIGLDQTVYPPVDTVLHSRIHLDQDVSAPITNHFDARITPDDRALPIILTNSLLTLPLRKLGLFYTPPVSSTEESAR